MAELFAADPGVRLPSFALIVAAAASDSWHSAALVRHAGNIDFFVRSIATPWPFVLARPRPSTRQSEQMYRPDELSPAGTSPARKLVVNWAWEQVDATTEQLRFYVRCRGPMLLRTNRPLPLRLRLKEQAAPQRRFTVQVVSNLTEWRPKPAQSFVMQGSPATG